MKDEQICNAIKQAFENELQDVILGYEKSWETIIEVARGEEAEGLTQFIATIYGRRKNTEAYEICEINEVWWEMEDTEENNLHYANLIIRIGSQIYRVRLTEYWSK